MLRETAKRVEEWLTGDLKTINTEIAGYIWRRWQRSVASFAFGNEPDWHAFHTYEGHPWDPAVYEQTSGVPGTAYASYLAHWQSFADAVAAAAPGALLSGPDTGACSTMTLSCAYTVGFGKSVT